MELKDCAVLYPDLITNSVKIGGSESKLFCVDPSELKVQGREYFNTYQEVDIEVKHCKLGACEGLDLDDYWDKSGLVIHNIENNIDLQDLEKEGKPT